jgi:hypothetical protein
MSASPDGGDNIILPAQQSHDTTLKEQDVRAENENERLLLFSDGIIAFALTIIMLYIKVESGRPETELPTIFSNLASKIGQYILTRLSLSVSIGRSITASFIISNALTLSLFY